jgi:hypothetical protein
VEYCVRKTLISILCKMALAKSGKRRAVGKTSVSKNTSPLAARSVAPNGPVAVERRIHFFRAEVAPYNHASPVELDGGAICKAIEALQWNQSAANTVYWEPEPDVVHVAKVDSYQYPALAPRHRLRFFTIRRNDIPLLEVQGTFSPLTIPAHGGLAEAVYVAIFPNNIVGAVYNYHGPRLPRLGSYLHAKAPAIPQVMFAALIRGDALARLNRLTSLSSVTIRMSQAAIDALYGQNKDFDAMFGAMRSLGTTKSAEVTLTGDRHIGLGTKVKRIVTWLLHGGSLSQAATADGVEQLIVKGWDAVTDRTATFDLLSEHVVMNRKIIRQSATSRALEEHSAYREIESAYFELADELGDAISLSVN